MRSILAFFSFSLPPPPPFFPTSSFFFFFSTFRLFLNRSLDLHSSTWSALCPWSSIASRHIAKNQASKAPMQVSSQQQLCQQKMIRGNMPKHSTLNSTNIYQISFSSISFITLQNGSSRMEWRYTNGNIRYPFHLNISNNVKYQINEQERNPPELKFYTNDYQVIRPYYHQIW